MICPALHAAYAAHAASCVQLPVFRGIIRMQLRHHRLVSSSMHLTVLALNHKQQEHLAMLLPVCAGRQDPACMQTAALLRSCAPEHSSVAPQADPNSAKGP